MGVSKDTSKRSLQILQQNATMIKNLVLKFNLGVTSRSAQPTHITF